MNISAQGFLSIIDCITSKNHFTAGAVARKVAPMKHQADKIRFLSRQTAIPCSYMRGGTSKGIVLHARDLTTDIDTRNRVLAAAMGGPDVLQIDGIGGGHSLSSKVAIVSPASDREADIDYLFLQVNPATGSVDTTQNCGNMLVACAPFAIEEGLVKPADGETRVRVRMLNSGNLCELTVQTPGGCVEYAGTTRIDGVPGTGAAIVCDYLDVAGSACGVMLPTGNAADTIEGVNATLIDNGMPVVVIRAADLGLSGEEMPQELESNSSLVAIKERIRLQAGKLMGLGDVGNKSVPKITLVSAARNGGNIATRTFIPHFVHKSIGVLGAASVATACLLPGSVTENLVANPAAQGDSAIDFSLEHPSGSLQLKIRARLVQGELVVERVGVVRTARMLMRGELFIPQSIWQGNISPPPDQPAQVAHVA
jgi:4-oxalomesaconate tautomerase